VIALHAWFFGMGIGMCWIEGLHFYRATWRLIPVAQSPRPGFIINTSKIASVFSISRRAQVGVLGVAEPARDGFGRRHNVRYPKSSE